jgi:8-oxo-dGTP diphosphatase
MKRVVAALIVKDDLILACQRTRHQPMPLKWEFPGGKIEDGEQPRDAMRREIEEELGIVADVGVEVARIVHEYPGGGSVELRFFEVRHYQGEVENRIFREIRWVTRQELLGLDFLEADLSLVKDLAAGRILWVQSNALPDKDRTAVHQQTENRRLRTSHNERKRKPTRPGRL